MYQRGMVINMTKEKRLIKFQNLVIYFYLCAFLGWVLETIYAFMVHGTFVKRGFLYGPICPIYGFGVIFLVIISQKLSKKKINIVTTFFFQ